MAINKITAPLSTGPSVFASPVIAQLASLLTDCNHGIRISGGYVKAGSLWNIGGTMFIADSDTAITGTRSASTTGVKFTVSGDSATVSYGTGTLTWNGIYQGYYDTSGNYYYKGNIISGTILLDNQNSEEITVRTSNSSYTEMTSRKVLFGGIYKIITSARANNAGNNYVRVYINGVAVGSELNITTVTTSTLTEGIYIEDGDKIQLFAHSNGVREFYASMKIEQGSYGLVL